MILIKGGLCLENKLLKEKFVGLIKEWFAETDPKRSDKLREKINHAGDKLLLQSIASKRRASK